jgi:hypothetical protein
MTLPSRWQNDRRHLDHQRASAKIERFEDSSTNFQSSVSVIEVSNFERHAQILELGPGARIQAKAKLA